MTNHKSPNDKAIQREALEEKVSKAILFICCWKLLSEAMVAWTIEILEFRATEGKAQKATAINAERAQIAALKSRPKMHVLMPVSIGVDVRRKCCVCDLSSRFICFGCGDGDVGNYFYCDSKKAGCFWQNHSQKNCSEQTKASIEDNKAAIDGKRKRKAEQALKAKMAKRKKRRN